MPAMPADAVISDDLAYAAFEARDRASDGAFVVAVRTTHIYCKPSCPARRPRRENIRFYADGPAARAAGYRPCLRCRPDEAARDGEAVRAAIRLIGDSDARLPLARIAEAVGYAPHHFHRLFRLATGMTPAAYARNQRADRLARHLRKGEGSVTEAIYQAGYEAPSRAYADAARRLGMTPAAWMTGGAGAVIRHVSVAIAGGSLLIAATERGLCHVAEDEDAEVLRTLFPGARIVAGGAAFEARVGDALKTVGALSEMPLAGELPTEMRAEAVSQAIWRALDMALFGER